MNVNKLTPSQERNKIQDKNRPKRRKINNSTTRLKKNKRRQNRRLYNNKSHKKNVSASTAYIQTMYPKTKE